MAHDGFGEDVARNIVGAGAVFGQDYGVCRLDAAAVCEPIGARRQGWQRGVQGFEECARVGVDLDVGAERRLLQLVGIDVDHDLRRRASDGVVGVAAEAQAHARADHQQQVGVLHDEVGRTLPKDAGSAEE